MEQELGVCHRAVLISACFHLPSAPPRQSLLQGGVTSCQDGISFSETGSPSGWESSIDPFSFPSVKLLRKSSFWGDEDFSSLMAKGTCISP